MNASPQPDHAEPTEPRDYEPPRLERLGTLQQLTLGHEGHASDGIFTGSILA